jgi:hypothetical protein
MSQNHRHPVAHAAAISVSLLLTCAGLGSATAPHAAAVPSTPCATGAPLSADFDGDAGADLVVGAERPNSSAEFGDQYLQPSDGSPGIWLLDVGSLRSADLNGDTCADAILFHGGHVPSLKLALGTPEGLDVAGATEVTIPQAADVADDTRRSLTFEAAGLRHDGISQIAVSGRHVIDLEEDGPEDYGAYIDLLTLDPSLTVSTTQVFTVTNPTPWDFGSALATSGRTVAVGDPTATVSGKVGAGAVRIYTTDSADPTHMVLRKVLTQNSAGVPGAAESYDGFGSSLAMRSGRLAIGVPGETDGKHYSAGLVQPILWHESTRTYKAYRSISQDTSGVPDKNEEGDAFGMDVALGRGLTEKSSYDIVIGSRESVGSVEYAGSVTVANFSKSLYRAYTQASAGIPGNPQTEDYFSYVGVLRSATGADTVLIGSPGEDSDGTEDLGRVIRSNATKLTSKTVWTNVAVPSDAPAGLRNWGVSVGADG